MKNVDGNDGLVCVVVSDKMKPEDVVALRNQYGLSVKEFAKKFGLPEEKVEQWERSIVATPKPKQLEVAPVAV